MTVYAPPLPAPPSPFLRPLSRPEDIHAPHHTPNYPNNPNNKRNTNYIYQPGETQLARTKTNKARGLDDISPKVLKVCAEQLA